MRLEGMIPRCRGMFIVRSAAMALVLAALCACGVDPIGRSCGTETPDEHDVALMGCVDHEQGGPAVGVRVAAYALPSGATKAAAGTAFRASRPAESVVTNHLGEFFFAESELPPGAYNLIIEDTTRPGPDDRSIRFLTVERDSGSVVRLKKVIQLARPQEVQLRVVDQDADTAVMNAVCALDFPHYSDTTRELGIAAFYLPAGTYVVSCAVPGVTPLTTRQIIVQQDGLQATIPLRIVDSRDNSLEAPAHLTTDYDSVTGEVRLDWTPVKHPQRTSYGWRRVDIVLGGGPYEETTQDTTDIDVPFREKTDSVQQKILLYSVYSLRSPIFEKGSRQERVVANRPLAKGSRIDSIYALHPDTTYMPGDTARIVAVWRNIIRPNDTLYWRVKGAAQTLAGRKNPPASGRDTLAFPVTESGNLEIGLTIRDNAGYRSWDSRSFRFGKP